MKRYPLLMASLLTVFTLCSVAKAEDGSRLNEGSTDVTQVCHNSGVKTGLEGDALAFFADVCSDALDGLTFASEDPLSDDEAADIEQKCAEEAQESSDFDASFEQCVSRDLIDALKQKSQ